MTFNLLDQPWIPIPEQGKINLKEVFNNEELPRLGGNSVDKICLLKLFLSIAQAAWTPKDINEYKEGGTNLLKDKVNAYLDRIKDRFDLYGEKPIFQNISLKNIVDENTGVIQGYKDKLLEIQEKGDPSKEAKIKKKELKRKIKNEEIEKKPLEILMPHLASGNTSIFKSSQVKKIVGDDLITMALLRNYIYPLGSKKIDHTLVMTKGYEKGKTGSSGPGVGYIGYLHSFVFGKNLLETIYLNLLNLEEINGMPNYSGLGKSPLEHDLLGEDDELAKEMKDSYLGRMLPASRFMYLTQGGLVYTEGIVHKSHKDGKYDASISIKNDKDIKAIWTSMDKKPWRTLTSTLSFLKADSSTDFTCFQLKYALNHVEQLDQYTIWAGGVPLASNSGEQKVGNDANYIESEFTILTEWDRALWFTNYGKALDLLDNLSKFVYSSNFNYQKTLNTGREKEYGVKASTKYWALLEKYAQDLVTSCINTESSEYKKVMRKCIYTVNKIYDEFAPHETNRQMDAWAKNKPNLGKFYSMFKVDKVTV